MRRVVLLAALVAGIACADVGTDPSAPVAIAFNQASLPWPSILRGDTLRDSLGDIAPVRARVYNGRGELIDAPVTFVVFGGTGDSAANVVVTPEGYVVSEDPATPRRSVSIQASVGRLFPPAVSLTVVPDAPDSIVRADTLPDTLSFTFASDTAVSRTALAVRVLSGSTGVPAWLVQWELGALPAGVTDAWLVPSASSRDTLSQRIDTTDASGLTSRHVRAVLERAAPAGEDTLWVEARILVRGEPVDTVRLPLVVRVVR